MVELMGKRSSICWVWGQVERSMQTLIFWILLIIFYRQDTHQKVSCRVSFFISKAWVVIWYNYYYYSRMRKTHTFCALLSGFEGYYIIVEWEKRTFFEDHGFVHVVQIFKLFMFNLHHHDTPLCCDLVIDWLPQLPSASQTKVLGCFFSLHE